MTSASTSKQFLGDLNSTQRMDFATVATIGIVLFTILAWISTLILMGDMDEGPGTNLHDFPTFLIGWIIMLSAMMLPSEIVYVKTFATLQETGLKNRKHQKISFLIHLTSFISGYVIVWISYGTLAFILDTVIRETAFEFISWNQEGPIIAGAVLFFAGVYQISSLKRSCLIHCTSPLSFFSRKWKSGFRGSMLMGILHGFICVACCWALMAVMFAVGAMNLIWMGLLTLFMFVEKVLPSSQKLAVPIAAFLWIMGLWIALSPDTVPYLNSPSRIEHVHKHHHEG